MTTAFDLLRLPAELRDRVYAHADSSDRADDANLYINDTFFGTNLEILPIRHLYLPALALTNTQVCSETIEALFKDRVLHIETTLNTMTGSIESDVCSSTVIGSWLDGLAANPHTAHYRFHRVSFGIFDIQDELDCAIVDVRLLDRAKNLFESSLRFGDSLHHRRAARREPVRRTYAHFREVLASAATLDVMVPGLSLEHVRALIRSLNVSTRPAGGLDDLERNTDLGVGRRIHGTHSDSSNDSGVIIWCFGEHAGTGKDGKPMDSNFEETAIEMTVFALSSCLICKSSSHAVQGTSGEYAVYE